MENVIIISVLSTLGVVAIVFAIVVAFVKLSKKVGVSNFRLETDNIYRRIEQAEEGLYNHFNKEVKQLQSDIKESRQFTDSRCDKLDNKIKEKQILTD
jgi:hypothetical protein